VSRPNRSAGINPKTQFAEIYRDFGQYEHPWMVRQVLSFALFRTFAVPGIGGLLARTGEFT
jgi:hypothetical protein